MKKRSLIALIATPIIAATLIGGLKSHQHVQEKRAQKDIIEIQNQKKYLINFLSSIHNCDQFRNIQTALYESAESNSPTSQQTLQDIADCFPESTQKQIQEFADAQIDWNTHLINKYQNYSDISQMNRNQSGYFQKAERLSTSLKDLGVYEGYIFDEPNFTLSQAATAYALSGHSSRSLPPKRIGSVSVDRPVYELIKYTIKEHSSTTPNLIANLSSRLDDKLHYLLETPGELKKADGNNDNHITTAEFARSLLPILDQFVK
jgi:hypothetical protein